MPPPLNRSELAQLPWISWGLAALSVILVLKLHLLPAALGALLVFSLVGILVPRLRISALDDDRRRVLAVALVATVVIAVLVAVSAGVTTALKRNQGSLPELFARMAAIIEASRGTLPTWVLERLPDDAAELQAMAAEWLREHARTLQTLSTDALRGFAHAVIGMVVGGMLALHRVATVREDAPFSSAAAALGRRLAVVFRNVVFAQVWISSINTALTWAYLGLLLPAFGVHLPLTKTLVLVTFLAGLMPILGNLISNTAIFVVSLSHGLPLAFFSLGYLVVIHKLEYFLNARIIGGHIQAKAWELLCAMLLMEAAFGIPGLIVAPVVYAFFKDEFRDRGLV